MKRNITKQLCVCVALYELLTALLALELALPEEEKIPKHTCSTQYQFKVFKNVDFSCHCAGTISTRQGRCCFVIVLCNVRREMLMPILNDPH